MGDERKRQERIHNDPEYREKYLARKRAESRKRGKLDPAYEAARKRRWRANNPDKNMKLRRAHRAIENAVRYGKIIRPTACQRCGVECETEAHHHGYERELWLDVEWLCSVCHGAADRERKRMEQ